MIRTLLLVLSIGLTFGSAIAQDQSNRPLITVTGQAEIMVVPDEVAFNLKVVSMDKNLLTAQAKNDETVKALLALARRYQIPPHLMQTDHITLSERYTDEDVTKKPPVFLGYTVSKRVAIVLSDVNKAEQLLADIFKSGVSTIEDVDFRTTQVRKYKDQARAMAIKAAQEKAMALAKEIGQTIGKAYSITEEGLRNPNYSANTTNSFSSVRGSYSDDESTIALGQISITARVVVSFELK
jgi:uncharacterized protein